MIHIREAIVVEGKYDAARLHGVVDALVVETGGFRVFRDAQRVAFLRKLAAERGLIILTDSDAAGFVIRNHLNGIIPPHQITHAYIPPIAGKERRKSAPSKEGLLGVEGMDDTLILEALRRCGATFCDTPTLLAEPPLTTADLFIFGLSGRSHSAAKRQALLALLGLPSYLSTTRLLDVLNRTMTREDIENTLYFMETET